MLLLCLLWHSCQLTRPQHPFPSTPSAPRSPSHAHAADHCVRLAAGLRSRSANRAQLAADQQLMRRAARHRGKSCDCCCCRQYLGPPAVATAMLQFELNHVRKRHNLRAQYSREGILTAGKQLPGPAAHSCSCPDEGQMLTVGQPSWSAVHGCPQAPALLPLLRAVGPQLGCGLPHLAASTLQAPPAAATTPRAGRATTALFQAASGASMQLQMGGRPACASCWGSGWQGRRCTTRQWLLVNPVNSRRQLEGAQVLAAAFLPSSACVAMSAGGAAGWDSNARHGSGCWWLLWALVDSLFGSAGTGMSARSMHA